MDATRFDRLTRSLIPGSSRRTLLSGLAAALGASVLTQTGPTLAKKKRKRKLVFNQFGCVAVGGKCRGNSANCCSGICEGRKPKKGKRDKSRCVAHDTGGCPAGQLESFCGGDNIDCTTSTGSPGHCTTTTGNAGYCRFTATCSPCRKDADCEPVCGPGAACLTCATCIDDGGTRCAGTGPDACTFD